VWRSVVITSLLGLVGCGPPTVVDPYATRREAMVREQIAARGIRSEAVLRAMRTVPRERFVPEAFRAEAYADHPLPIGEGQTISQPYVVAWMTELSAVRAGDRVLEVGTGSGYQAAVLAELGAEVWTIEIVEPLARRAAQVLGQLGYTVERGGRVRTRVGDGYAGWPEAAPFDAILLTAAPEQVPEPLLAQLAVGGRLVAPVGPPSAVQELVVVTRTATGETRERVGAVRFVPMTGRGAAESPTSER
jgi:protein-L-isoaspartate(D-aspartate) O-methyltransferase